MRCWLVVLLLLLVPPGLAGPALADQSDPRLDELFVKLKVAPNEAAAAAVERAIWGVWLEHGDQIVVMLMLRAGADMQRRDWSTALAKLDQVVALAPGYAEGWNRRATLLFLLKRYEESLADIERVLALEPRHFGALAGRGLCLMSLDRPEEAVDAFQAALALNPQMPGARENLEILNDQLGNDI